MCFPGVLTGHFRTYRVRTGRTSGRADMEVT